MAPAGSAGVSSTTTPARPHRHPRRFEIIYAGGAGAMQAFGRRLDQDEILRVMAYLEVLRANAD